MNDTTSAATLETQTNPVKSTKYQKESILVVSAELLRRVAPKTFSKNAPEVLPVVLANYTFMERNLAEHDESFKQVIPYVMVVHENRYLLIRRTKKQGEARLHDMYSLGIGGHINDVDSGSEAQHSHIIEAGMRRELNEEIGIEKEASCELVGMINDNSTEVARVHVGFVYLLRAGSPQFTIMEQDKYTASWKTGEEMAEHYAQMESWAQIAYDYVVCGGATDRVNKWETRA